MGTPSGEERLRMGGVFEQVDVLRVFAYAVRRVSLPAGALFWVLRHFGRVVFSLVGGHRFLWFWSVSSGAR